MSTSAQSSGAQSGAQSGTPGNAPKPEPPEGPPKPDAPKPDAPKPDAPKPDAPKPDAPKGPPKAQLHAASRAAAKARAKLAEDVERLCADAGITLAMLAREAGVPYQQLWRMMAGKAAPSIETYAKLAIPLGADLATRLYPNTGPTIRDHHQARILEALLPISTPYWRPHLEVTIWKPSHGSIDVVLHRADARLLIAVEIQSELRRLEQIVRWSQEKAESLPSSSIWGSVNAGPGGPPSISQLLIVRRTRATQAVGREFARQLAVAFPAHPDDALAALQGTAPWPGAALIWADIKPDRVRFLSTR